MSKRALLFFEGEIEKIVFEKWVKDLINDEKIKIEVYTNENLTYCKDKNKNSKYHTNFFKLKNAIDLQRQKYKDNTIIPLYVFDNAHLNYLKNNGYDYLEIFKMYKMCFISFNKTFDDKIYNFLLKYSIYKQEHKNQKMNKTKILKSIREYGPLNAQQEKDLIELIISNIITNNQSSQNYRKYFI